MNGRPLRRTRLGRTVTVLAVTAGVGLASGCVPAVDVAVLAGDAYGGRNNNTEGSEFSQRYLVWQLQSFADGLNTGETGDDAYLQPFTNGTNVLGVIPGTDLADEYVIVGAHYDHVGSSCRSGEPGDTICNGATDNATGVAAALEVGRTIARGPTPPRRSVIIALWDREEDGLLGSLHYTQNPLVPLADTVAYVNFDIQGANLLPSLRGQTVAVAAESGGTALQDIVRDAAAPRAIDTTLLSSIFGQGRSDYVRFLDVGIPSVFFTDSTGPCYHTAQDEVGIVDFTKLNQQITTARAATRALANADDPPAFVGGQPLATFDDLLGVHALVELGAADRSLLSPADQATYDSIRATFAALVADGAAAFGPEDIAPVLVNTANLVQILTHGECDGFLEGL